MRIREFLAQKDAKSNTIRPYKNASNVFVHLVDDPTTRRKVDRNTGRNSCKQKYHALCSLIGALNRSRVLSISQLDSLFNKASL